MAVDTGGEVAGVPCLLAYKFYSVRSGGSSLVDIEILLFVHRFRVDTHQKFMQVSSFMQKEYSYVLSLSNKKNSASMFFHTNK